MANNEPGLTPTNLARAAGISVPYASQILSGVKTPPAATAIRIFRATGQRFGAISDATEDEIAVLERFQGAA
jgi:transcriptional regulator with XRE-family HTH domain